MARSVFFLLRTKILYHFFILMIKYLPFVIPGERLRETETLLAFFHPRPVHPFHVLIIPKQAFRNLMELDPAGSFLSDVVKVSQSIIDEFHLPAYRLVVNGGKYQEFPHLHFHLISDEHLSVPTAVHG